MANAIDDVKGLGQAVWYGNIRRGVIESGELQRLIDLGVTGLTSNPTIFEKAITGSSDYDDALLELAREGKSASEIYERLAMDDIRAAADLLRPSYDSTRGADGYASFEVNPHLAHDTEGTVVEAKRLFAALDRPNVMIKIPATPEGVPAIRELIGEGLNINVTLTFSLMAYTKVREAYIAGLEDLERSGGDPGSIASVASFFVSRVDTAVDKLLEETDDAGTDDLRGKAAIANAKKAYRDFETDFGADRFTALRDKGARVQRPLWASTSTKNPEYSDVMYVESLIGPDTVDTMPEATLMAMLEHGRAANTLQQDVAEADDVFDSLEAAGVDMDAITQQLLADGVNSFADSYDSLVANIEEKRVKLLAEEGRRSDGAGQDLWGAEEILATLDRDDVVGRIMRKDHTVWSQDPDEVADRLGWLDIAGSIREQVAGLQEFAEGVRDDGFQHLVLLGMGGSSLAPEVLRQTFGSAPGYPKLLVLDSSLPARVSEVTRAIDPARTLFIVSSKSGNTVETDVLYRHFRGLVEQVEEADHVAHSFVAITDEDSPLEHTVHEDGFRAAFLNPSDIGGRYSVLSYFGLAPAALMGLDLTEMLDRADRMREACGAPGQQNPGAVLGAVMGSLAATGRDKLTLLTSPAVDSFGLWVEQLLAESTGKDGVGIVPVAAEPALAPGSYGDDRLFVYLRLEDDDNAKTDAEAHEIESAGHPVLRLDIQDRYDLAGEFFRWEFATAVAGSILKINPFDQPDVESAKGHTTEVLGHYEKSDKLPDIDGDGSLDALLSKASPGDYLAIQAFVLPTPQVEDALIGLRARVGERHKIATTAGYGPRYLHSTGQLHKGGPDSGLFLQLTEDHGEDLPIPGESHTFGVLADAQAIGDLQALQERKRRVARVHLGSDTAGAIAKLAAQIG